MKGFNGVRSVLVLLAAAALLAGCGESPGSQASPTQANPEPQAEQEYDLSATSQAATRQLGGHASAAYAILKAADRGYSAYQVAAAVNAGLLDGRGVIQGVSPTGPAGNLLSSRQGTTRFASASFTEQASPSSVLADNGDGVTGIDDLEQLFAQITDQGLADRWLVWVLGAAGAGYSVRQITEYLGAGGTPEKPAAPLWGGVAVIYGSDGKVAAPELGADWPYHGRAILRDLQQDPDLDYDDTFTILVIGLVNAGYSTEQIGAALSQHSVALKTSTIGLCKTTDGTALTVGWIDSNGQLVPPEGATPGTHPPGTIVMADVTPYWPTHTAATATATATASAAASPADDALARFNSGQTVTLRLTPYFARKDTGMVITSHEVLMTLVPSSSSDSAVITCTWTIEITQATDTGKWAPGTRLVLRGEAWDTDGDARGIRDFQKMEYTSSYTEYLRTGEERYTYNDSGIGFSGHLNEYLEGDGTLPGGPAAINWDTFSGVGAGGQ